MKKKYRSAVDVWLAAILIGAPLLAIGQGILMLAESNTSGLMVIGIGVLIGVFMALFTIPCHYTVDDRILKIKCGVLKEDILIERIRKVEKSRNPLTAPALSLKRVKVILDDGFRIISPKERDRFIESIQQEIQKRA